MKVRKLATGIYTYEEEPNATDACGLIQWGMECVDASGQFVCPECGCPAERIMSLFGHIAFAHVKTGAQTEGA